MANSGLSGRFLNARSFGSLRGFSRVGGVLIGRPPAEGGVERFALVDIRWLPEGPTTGRFVLVGPTGKTYRSGVVRRSVAYSALVYAADGRPLAVTMVTAKPLPELKILLHPTLVDTPMGARVIDLDRFVDTFAGGDDLLRRLAEATVNAQGELYRFAWACRVLASRGVSDATFHEIFTKIPPGYREAVIKEAERIRKDPAILKRIELAVKDPAALSDPERCPLTAKPEFFEKGLVDDLIAALKIPGASTDPENLAKALLDRQQPRFEPIAETPKVRDDDTIGLLLKSMRRPREIGSKQEAAEELGRSLSFPPEFVIWSGVREKDFAARPEDLLVPESGKGDVPFDFMLQIAFTSSPAFGPRDTGDREKAYTDPKPWEFPALKKHLQERVVAGIAKDERSRTILDDCSEFARLQRLFRAAFAGRLGSQFPVERLAALEEMLAPATPPRALRTPRWNSRAGQAELSVLAAFQEIVKEVDDDAGPDEKKSDAYKSLRGRLNLRVKLLDEFKVRFLEHVKTASLDGESTEARDRLWADWKKWRIEWLDRYKALETFESTQGGATPAPEPSPIVAQSARLDRYLETSADLRNALNILRDDRLSIENGGSKLPPLDP